MMMMMGVVSKSVIGMITSLLLLPTTVVKLSDTHVWGNRWVRTLPCC
jgi:hypothetical protein